MKTLSRCTLSPKVLSKQSKSPSQRCLSVHRFPFVPSLLSSSGLLCWVLVLSVVVQCQGQDVAEHRNTETDTVDRYLSTFGYYPEDHGVSQDDALSRSGAEGGTTSEHTEVDRQGAIKRLQSFFHLPASGQLDAGTKRILRSARCGRKDIESDDPITGGALSRALQIGGRRRVKRYNVNRYGDGSLANWNVSQLTWRISRPSRQLSESQQREIIRTSLAMWGEYVPIRFVEDRSQDTPDIDIHFARGEHGPKPDPVFDGKPEQTLNILAHAWGPGYNIKGLAGDVHFDDDDDWKDYNSLLGVAVHELGHSMGLGHSEDESAIMYPVYRDVVQLGQDDIDGITLMYGSATGARPRPRTQAPIVWTYKPEQRYSPERPDIRFRTERPDIRFRTERPDIRFRTERPDPRYNTERPDPRYRTERPDTRYRTERPDPRYRTERPDPRYRTERQDQRTRAPYYTLQPEWIHPPTTQPPVDVCADVNVDAVFEDPTAVIGRKYIAVSDEEVHTLTQHGDKVNTKRLQDVYPGVPKNPDVGFSIYKKRTVYFIKDNVMWAYKDGQLEEGYPRSLRSLQFPEPPKYTVTLKQRDGSERLLLFGARYWWILDVDRQHAVQSQHISTFSGQLPQGVRFAARWIDNNLYAVTQDSYVIMDLESRRITHEGPIAGKPDWLKALCGHSSRVTVSVTSLLVVALLSHIVKSFVHW
ncbi:hypothetical protein BsWGS_22051 [Bradybaena similaris]